MTLNDLCQLNTFFNMHIADCFHYFYASYTVYGSDTAFLGGIFSYLLLYNFGMTQSICFQNCFKVTDFFFLPFNNQPAPKENFQNLSDIEVSDEDPIETGTIIGVAEAKLYPSCPNKKCHDKALDEDHTCLKCNTTYMPASTGTGAVAKIAVEYNDDIETFTIFKPSLKFILNFPTAGQLKQAILDILPLKVSFRCSKANIITYVQSHCADDVVDHDYP